MKRKKWRNTGPKDKYGSYYPALVIFLFFVILGLFLLLSFLDSYFGWNIHEQIHGLLILQISIKFFLVSQ